MVSRIKYFADLLAFVFTFHDIFTAVASKMSIVQRYKAFSAKYSKDLPEDEVQCIKNLAGLNIVCVDGNFMYFPKATPSTNIEEYLILVFVFMYHNKYSAIVNQIALDGIISKKDQQAMYWAYTGGRLGAILWMQNTAVYKAVEARLKAAAKYTTTNSTNLQACDVIYLAQYWVNAHIDEENKKTCNAYMFRDIVSHCIEVSFDALVRSTVVHRVPFQAIAKTLKELLFYNSEFCSSGCGQIALLARLHRLFVEEKGEVVNGRTRITEINIEMDAWTGAQIVLCVYDRSYYHIDDTRLAIGALREDVALHFFGMLPEEEIMSKFRSSVIWIAQMKKRRAARWLDPRHKRELAMVSVRAADLATQSLWNNAILVCQPQC